MRHSYRVNGLSRDAADVTLFDTDDDRRLSVAQYFEQIYECGGGTRSSRPCLDVVAPQKKNYSPLEVCHIFAGQKCARKPTDKQVANMIRFTCTPRDQRDRAEAA